VRARRLRTRFALLLLDARELVAAFRGGARQPAPILCKWHGAFISFLANVTPPHELLPGRDARALEREKDAELRAPGRSSRAASRSSWVPAVARRSRRAGTRSGHRRQRSRWSSRDRRRDPIRVRRPRCLRGRRVHRARAARGAIAGFFGGGVDFFVARAVADACRAFPCRSSRSSAGLVSRAGPMVASWP